VPGARQGGQSKAAIALQTRLGDPDESFRQEPRSQPVGCSRSSNNAILAIVWPEHSNDRIFDVCLNLRARANKTRDKQTAWLRELL
jgi:hypothetical protein